MLNTLLLIVRGAAVAAAAWALLGGTASAAEPLWPLDLPTRYLTSDFMEHRSGRFHTGIDLKTGGRKGFVVRAAEDGWISRLKTTAGGYGKALYLRGESGRTYVYAHLDRFHDDLADRAAAARAGGLYSVDLRLPPRAATVRRGDALALSGETGTLGPHLHFEVRDSGQRPLNPQREGFTVGDVIPPRITAIRAVPAGPESRVMGSTAAHVIETGKPLSGRLPRLAVSGPVAFTVSVVDHSDARGHRLEPYRLTVRLDGETVFEARNDALSFDQNGTSRLEWFDGPRGRERWLLQRDGNDLPGRRGGSWSLDPAVLAPGRHHFICEAADAEGNSVSVGFELAVAAPAEAEPEGGAGWREDPVRVELPAATDGARRWLTPFLLLEESAAGETTAAPAAVLGEGPPWFVMAPDTLDAAEVREMAERQGLRWLGWAGECLAADWPAKHAVRAEFAAGCTDSLTAADAVYMLGSDGRWSLVDRPAPAGGPDSGRFAPAGPGRYALLRDAAAPYLGPGPFEGVVRPDTAAARPGFAARRWAPVAIGLEDLGSGVDPDQLRAEIDGRTLVPEPDLPRDRLLLLLPDDLEAGEHSLEIRVRDLAGNRAARRYGLVLAP